MPHPISPFVQALVQNILKTPENWQEEKGYFVNKKEATAIWMMNGAEHLHVVLNEGSVNSFLMGTLTENEKRRIYWAIGYHKHPTNPMHQAVVPEEFINPQGEMWVPGGKVISAFILVLIVSMAAGLYFDDVKPCEGACVTVENLK